VLTGALSLCKTSLAEKASSMALSFEVPPVAKKEEASLSHSTFFSHTCHTPLSL
tara:strand:+ start:421 stop:582 length:162 start_codon:yes stop_codon:yes gene_type:complete